MKAIDNTVQYFYKNSRVDIVKSTAYSRKIFEIRIIVSLNLRQGNPITSKL